MGIWREMMGLKKQEKYPMNIGYFSRCSVVQEVATIIKSEVLANLTLEEPRNNGNEGFPSCWIFGRIGSRRLP